MDLYFEQLELEGAYTGKILAFEDERGDFTKVYHTDVFSEILNNFSPKEIYQTTSKKGVLRGMHFQLPPDDHAKIVICMKGEILDVLLDIRQGKNFGKVVSLNLSPSKNNFVVLPRGVAHGFYSKKDNSQVVYIVETVHSIVSDAGILWNSFDYQWPTSTPILSSRDQQHPTLANFRYSRIDF